MATKLTRQTHKIAIQLHLVAESLYHLQFSLQETISETFGYTFAPAHVCEIKYKMGLTSYIHERGILMTSWNLNVANHCLYKHTRGGITTHSCLLWLTSPPG